MGAGEVGVEQTPTVARFSSNKPMLTERPTMPRAGLKAISQWLDAKSAE